ncbi:hypothetical protein [Longimicrobium sp.]|uniref:hypothetical protein n=1 Tax=Longimicrobium sp. TaxID=2029185 RepID=UPI003B3B3707
MMMHRALLGLVAAACVAAGPANAAAQKMFGPALEASFGVFAGAGGTFDARRGPALDMSVALPLGRMESGTLVGGVTAGISGPLSMTDICRVGPNDTCMPDYPVFFTLGAVAGVQQAIGAGFSARALAGPAYFQGAETKDAFGLQGRLDVARPLFFHTAVIASVRGSLLPRYEGETLSYTAFGLGLRIQ